MADSNSHLRLVWPQWQGAGAEVVRRLAPEFPFDAARRGYSTGAGILRSILPEHHGPTAEVPVEMADAGLGERDGIEAKDAVLAQLRSALSLIREHDPDRITTLGGESSVSVAPFSALAEKYGNDLAIVWVSSRPEISSGDSEYSGFHAMAVTALLGHGDKDVRALLPAVFPAERVALVGLHEWKEDHNEQIAAQWGLSTFSPQDLAEDSTPLLDWLRGTGASRVALHFDVDVVDANEIRLGLSDHVEGMAGEQVRRIVADVDDDAEVVGLTIADLFPRQAMHLQQLMRDFPLLNGF